MILPKKRDPRFITVRRGGTLQDSDHHLLAIWAADCAQHVLHLFEEMQPNDGRPRRAIELARAWTRGEITMSQTRAAGGHAMAVARELNGAARHAAYAAGRRGWWRMSPHTRSVLRPTRSRPRVRRRLTVGLKKLVALSANGSVHNFQAKSGISCLTTRSCVTKSAGSYLIADRLACTTTTTLARNFRYCHAVTIFKQEIEMTRNMFVVLYIVVMIAAVVSVDLLFFKNQFWERLVVNIGIVLVFVAFYLRFLKNP